jgi:CxxC motif-containing protein (DUF1111 family)
VTLRSLLGIAVVAVVACAAAGNLAAGASAQERTWPGEELAGGATTVHDDTPTAYGRALANLDRGRWAAMRAGKRLFEYPWRSPDEVAATAPRRGLGPLHNATACTDCHFRDGRGGPAPAASRGQPGEPVLALAPLLAKLSLPSSGLADGPDPIYGAQLNDRGIGAAPEGRLIVEEERVTLADGTVLHRPRARVTDLSRGPLHPRTSISLRIPPTLVGLGLLEAVPRSRIEALADPDDRDEDGISGRVRRLGGEGADGPVGRFGWKAGEATLEGQVAKAFHEDLGVTSALYSEPNCPPGDDACRGAHGDVELDPEDLRRVVLYTRLLAPPARRDWRDPRVLVGRDAFMAVGCGACHRPRLETAPEGSNEQPLPELAGQTIRPYTDLLLHDMGPGLDDGVAEVGAASSEWRTPPLWGLGLLERVNGHARFLHDGRARSFEEAILWHGGEAAGAREAYRRLPEEKRLALLRFLRSL